LVRGLGLALAMLALTAVAAQAQTLNTQTTLTAETRDQNGQTQVTVAVAVTGEDGLPIAGPVSVFDRDKQLAGAALDAQGQAKFVLELPGGDHVLRASFAGDTFHRASVSEPASVQATVTAAPDFQVSVAPSTLSVTAGNPASVVATITPVNNGSLTAPMFVTLSCSGLPDQASCTFTPENLEILATTPTSCPSGSAASACPPTSTMVLTTSAVSGASISPAARPVTKSTPIAWAFLLPGALSLGGLAWGARRRRWVSRFSLSALVALVTLLGTTGCNPRYQYEHHGPVPNPATPPGTYTVTVTGQFSNGVTAVAHNTSFVLTVN
jgi:uncharacterized lipoprotein YajG